MVRPSLGAQRRGTIRRWLAPPALALIGSATVGPALALIAPASAAAASPTIVVSGDSVLATSLPSFGQTTVTATRPDAVTGAPVVIGMFAGSANPFTPFSVNSITPTPFNPSGDCWQKGALSEALTPDLQPGDTVNVTQAGSPGGGSSSSSLTVQPSALANQTLGPISGCSSIAPYARNAITSAPAGIQSATPLTVSGVAQPLATGVSVSATDGTKHTAPVAVNPAADLSWTATIPASALGSLGGNLTVTPVFSVPDVSTGAPAHIAGVTAAVKKSSSSSTAGRRPTTTGKPPTTGRPGATNKPRPQHRVSGLRVAVAVSTNTVQRHGIEASFIVPSGVHVVQIRLVRGHRTVYTTYATTRKPGTRQTITIPASKAKKLRPGAFTLSIKAGTSPSKLGPAVTHKIKIMKPARNA
jgi:hypothetical protein